MKVQVVNGKVELCRWKVNYEIERIVYKENPPNMEPTEEVEIENMELLVSTEKEADDILTVYKGNKERIATTEDEWIEGIEVESYEQALEYMSLGKDKYLELQKQKKKETAEALRLENEKLQQEVLELQLALVEVYGKIGGNA